jgi:AcrR family transcriptional regulator
MPTDVGGPGLRVVASVPTADLVRLDVEPVEGPRLDPRARRTRARLRAALLDLATHRPLDEISVGEIAGAAQVNRATFYLHYADKDALLLDALGAVMAVTAAEVASTPDDQLVDEDRPPGHTRAFFRELDERAPLYRRVLGPSGSAAVVAHLRAGLEQAITTELERRVTTRLPDGLTAELLAAFLTGAVFGSAIHWLEEEPRPGPDDIAETVWMLLTRATSVAGSKPARSESARSESAEPKSSKPKSSKPKTAKPKTAKPKTLKAKTAKPKGTKAPAKAKTSTKPKDPGGRHG